MWWNFPFIVSLYVSDLNNVTKSLVILGDLESGH